MDLSNMDINNGDFVDKLTDVRPSKNQLEWQKMEYYNFVHFGINTFCGKQWSDGSIPASKFNPTSLSTDQWCRAFKASGSTGVVLTAKHHDGFCLFPSKYTDYSIKNSPYKDGKGDIVKELAESCKKYGLKLGLYLSPWDRHEKTYGTPEYNDFFCNQLTELCTNYGDIFMFWFDGACGEGKNGKKQVYDFNRYFDLIKQYQPGAVTSVCGRDVRWIGNEAGKTRSSEWSVVPAELANYDYVTELSQQNDNTAFAKKGFETTQHDLGSRKILLDVEDLIWYPAEMDVSIYKSWFFKRWHAMFTLKTVEMLCNLYYESVGGNSALLLNVPPNKKGLIPKTAERRLRLFGERIKKEFSQPIPAKVEKGDNVYSLKFNKSKVSAVMLQEDISRSQRIESYEIYAVVNDVKIKLFEGSTIGWKKLCKFTPVNTDNITIQVLSCRNRPHITTINAFSD